MWTLEQITNALIPNLDSSQDVGFDVPLWDNDRRIGVGSTFEGHQVLIIPAQDHLTSFEKKYAKFSPWATAYWVEQNENLGKVAILTCNFDSTDVGGLRALAGIFRGLLEIEKDYGTAGNAILSLKKLFEEGLLEPDAKGVTGLIGELLVILGAPSKETMVEVWHTDPGDSYDFSWESNRLEVKSTRSQMREHKFSSFQIPGPKGIDLQIASVKVVTAEIGLMLGDLVSKVTAGLRQELVDKVLDQCSRALNVPVFAVTEPLVDLVSSLANIEFFAAEGVPSPISNSQILEMRWKASLEGVNSEKPIFPPSEFFEV